MKYKRIAAVCGAAAALALGGAAPGWAQLVPFQGQSLACFSYTLGGCTPTTGGFNQYIGNNVVTDPTGKLNFQTQSFSFTMGKGTQLFTVGNWSPAPAKPNPSPFNISEYFTLVLALTQPGANNSVFYASATGKLTFWQDPNNPLGVILDFDPSGPGVNWTNGPYANNGLPYTLTAIGNNYPTDIFKSPMQAAATVTPEPISSTLFGTGLLGLAFVRRRRKKKAESSNA